MTSASQNPDDCCDRAQDLLDKIPECTRQYFEFLTYLNKHSAIAQLSLRDSIPRTRQHPLRPAYATPPFSFAAFCLAFCTTRLFVLQWDAANRPYKIQTCTSLN